MNRLAGVITLCAVITALIDCTNLRNKMIKPEYLTVNGRTSALGIPRGPISLGWQVVGQGFQDSYRVTMFSNIPDKNLAKEGGAVIFDSGKVRTRRSECKVTLPHTMPLIVWWRVEIWDTNGHSTTSDPHQLVFGLNEEQREWQAEWLVDPVMKSRSSHAHQNSHSYFRKMFKVTKPVKSAWCFITADDYYKLYLNDKYIGQGPSPSYLDAYNFNTYDVTPYIKSKQINTIAVHTYYQGLVNRVWVSGDDKQGLIAQIEIEYNNGTTDRVVTDATWRVLASDAYPDSQYVGYKTQFLEHTTGRLIPIGWKGAAFDDSGWSHPLSLGRPPLSDYHLIPQITPPLQVSRIEPVEVKQIEANDFFVDFGREVVGHTGLVLRGPQDHRVEIRHGEELTDEGRVRFNMRACKPYQDFYTLAGIDGEEFQFYDYRGFRYVEVLNSPSKLNNQTIWVDARHHPFNETKSEFKSSDKRLEQIWNLCKAGVREGGQEVYVDCPTREKGQYLGDTFVAGTAHFYATGELLLQKKALLDFARSSKVTPTLLAVAPCAYRQEIADYSLQWILFLEEYYRHSGDLDFLSEVFPVLEKLLQSYQQWLNSDGLLEKVTPWNLVDWPDNLRDDYDYDRAVQGVNTVLNSFYVGALQAASRLAEALGKSELGLIYSNQADQVGVAVNKHLLNPQTGLYVDALGSDHSSLHANTLPLYFGFAPADYHSQILRLLESKRMSCGVYFSAFLLRALYQNGASEIAYDLLTCDDKHSWMNMINAGATTTMEAWGPDQKWNTSWCHAWASSPLFIIAEEIMGLRPLSPGWDEILIRPTIPNNSRSGKIRIFTKKGFISNQFKNQDDRLEFRIEIPGNSKGQFQLDSPSCTSISVDGRQFKNLEPVELKNFRFDLSPGDHKIVCRK